MHSLNLKPHTIIFYLVLWVNAGIIVRRNGAQFVDTCVGITQSQWDKYMKGHTRANRREVVKIALQAGVIDEETAKAELKNPWYNPYHHHKTKTHIIYVNSSIEHFIKVND